MCAGRVLESGFVAGFPLQDVRVTVYDGKTHPVDSKEAAPLQLQQKLQAAHKPQAEAE